MQQQKLVQDSFEELIQSNDFVVVEGTGHTGEPKVANSKGALHKKIADAARRQRGARTLSTHAIGVQPLS